MKVLISEKLSPHRYKDTNGYLICQDAILARTGKQTYRKNEIFADTEDDSEVEVDRRPEEVFSEKTMASFENCPITVEHPDEDVNPDNYKEYSVGFVRDVHKGEFEGQPVMLGTLVITDADTINEIENGEHTDLSCGYDADIVDEENPQQRNIRGNHVALCQQGRAGIARIVDSVKDYQSIEETNKRIEEMPWFARKEMNNSTNKEAKLIGIIGAIEDIVNAADPKIKEQVKMKGDKIIRDLKGQFGINDSIKDSLKIGDKVKIKVVNGNPTGIVKKINGDIIEVEYVTFSGIKRIDYYYTNDLILINDSIKDNWIGKIVETSFGSGKIIEIKEKNGKRIFKVELQPNVFIETDKIKFNGYIYDSVKDEYYTKSEKQDKRFVKNALLEMERYIRNWSFMSKKEKEDIGGSLNELKARVSELEKVNDSIKDVEPYEGENKADFISRFMEETKEEYPDNKQRLAVAYSYWENRNIKDAGENQEQMAQMQYDKLKRKRLELEKELERNDNNPHYNIDKANKEFEEIDNEMKRLKSNFGYAIHDSLSASDKQIIDDVMSDMKIKSVDLILRALNEQFCGFVGQNVTEIINYIKSKGIKDSKKYEISYTKDSIDYIQIVKAKDLEEAIKKIK